jgi:prolipoprotein diacylglyceryl transferase
MILASIPSPDQGVWHLGPFPVRAYALCIIIGIVVCVWMGERRWVARGGQPGTVGDIAIWAVPFGVVGGRLYHVVTDPELYFGDGQDPITALYVWRGGLGVWGAIGMGALGAYIGGRRRGIRFRAFADAVAPGLAVAQGIGRFGNWFNQELYGRPTDLPWGLEIDAEHRRGLAAEYQQADTFHPAFLYEALWNFGVAGLVIWADRRYRLGYGRAFALYVMGYTAGRGWIEYLRIDTVNHLFGVRLNVWTSIVLFVLALAYFVVVGRRHPGREADVQPSLHPEEPQSTEEPVETEGPPDREEPQATESDSPAPRGPAPHSPDPQSSEDGGSGDEQAEPALAEEGAEPDGGSDDQAERRTP